LTQFDVAPGKSGGGPPHSQDAVRDMMIIEIREASWTAPALWRFARKRKIRRISAELFCANDNLNCYRGQKVVVFGSQFADCGSQLL